MKMKYLLVASALMLGMGTVTLTSCSDDDDNTTVTPGPGGDGDEDGNQGGETLSVSGDVSGVWEAGSTVHVTGHLNVPEGETLTIEEGVTVVFDCAQVLNGDTGYEFIVSGNLYCKGTEANPVRLTVPEEYRTADYRVRGLWGGIIGTKTCEEILLDHTIIEYTGSEVTENSPSANLGIYTAGDDQGPQLTTNNVNGRYVVVNSTLRYGASDAIYMMGGQGIIRDNLFAVNGATGGEAINVKAGCTVDAANNVIYSPNTNGFKLASSGEGEDVGRYQARIVAYNNTIINAGWRRDGNKGGGIYVENNAMVNVYNNLLVNCKFKAQTPFWGTPGTDDAGADTESVIDYNYYIAGTQTSTLDFDVEEGTTSPFGNFAYTTNGDGEQVIYPDFIDLHSQQSPSAGTPDPLFVNYDFLADDLHNTEYNEAWDFHLQAGSPALGEGAYSGSDADMQPRFQTSGITVDGVKYTSPAPVARYGALGTK